MIKSDKNINKSNIWIEMLWLKFKVLSIKFITYDDNEIAEVLWQVWPQTLKKLKIHFWWDQRVFMETHNLVWNYLSNLDSFSLFDFAISRFSCTTSFFEWAKFSQYSTLAKRILPEVKIWTRNSSLELTFIF